MPTLEELNAMSQLVASVNFKDLYNDGDKMKVVQFCLDADRNASLTEMNKTLDDILGKMPYS